MSKKQIAVNTARYHSRMAVRAVRIFHCPAQAVASRARRDEFMQMARSA
jgi:hypothetical protein